MHVISHDWSATGKPERRLRAARGSSPGHTPTQDSYGKVARRYGVTREEVCHYLTLAKRLPADLVALVEAERNPQVLEAEDIAKSVNQRLTTAHVLLAMFTVENRAAMLLAEQGVNEDSLLELLTSAPSEGDGLVRELREKGKEIAANSGSPEIDCLHAMIAMTRVAVETLFREKQRMMASAVQEERRTGLFVFAAHLHYGHVARLWLEATLNPRAGMIGRHDAVDLALPLDDSLSLRHLMYVVRRKQDAVRFVAIDLESSSLATS